LSGEHEGDGGTPWDAEEKRKREDDARKKQAEVMQYLKQYGSVMKDIIPTEAPAPSLYAGGLKILCALIGGFPWKDVETSHFATILDLMTHQAAVAAIHLDETIDAEMEAKERREKDVGGKK
jgi:hypothetical protein